MYLEKLLVIARNMALYFSVALMLLACSPEPGSKRWCASMDEKSAGDWSTNEAAEYTKSCMFSSDE